MDKDTLKLYRKRYIPDEVVCLCGGTDRPSDTILELSDTLLVTSWKTLHPRMDFSGAVSAFFLDKGWKVSRIVDAEDNLVKWYCDIVDYVIDEENNSIICEDLLFDVVVLPNGKYKVLDCDEAATALEQGMITEQQMLRALRSLHELLEVIYHDRFDRVQAVVEGYL